MWMLSCRFARTDEPTQSKTATERYKSHIYKQSRMLDEMLLLMYATDCHHFFFYCECDVHSWAIRHAYWVPIRQMKHSIAVDDWKDIVSSPLATIHSLSIGKCNVIFALLIMLTGMTPSGKLNNFLGCEIVPQQNTFEISSAIICKIQFQFQ